MGVWAEAPGGPASQWAAGGGAGARRGWGPAGLAGRAMERRGRAASLGPHPRAEVTANAALGRAQDLGSEQQRKAEAGLLKHRSSAIAVPWPTLVQVDLRLKPVNQRFSRCGPRNNSSTGELARKADSLPCPRPTESDSGSERGSAVCVI